MKKFILLVTAIFIFAVSYAKAGGGYLNAPWGPPQGLQTADYGGVDRSTISLSTNAVLCFTGVGSVVGFVASSNTSPTDFITFRDTGSLIGNAAAEPTTDEFARVYLSTAALVINGSQDVKLGNTYSFPKPIRVYKGLVAKASVSTINMITILWNDLDR